MGVLPISPNEVVEAKKNRLPDFVIEAFNQLIAKNWTGRSSRVLVRDAVSEICRLNPSDGDFDPYKEGWLDVEPIYRGMGWTVEFDKPGYNESYEAYYLFSK